MFAALRRPREDAPADPAPPAPAAGDAALRRTAQQAALIGREAAELRGLLDHALEASARGTQTMGALAAQVGEVTRAQQAIADAGRSSLAAVDRARSAVQAIGDEVAAIVATLRQVSDAAGSIRQIALQTRLVAFNASVEARRAGDAGRGFAVVADAVKDLAARVEASSKQIVGTVGALNGRIDTLAREIRVEPGAGADDGREFHAALAALRQAVGAVLDGAAHSRAGCAALDEHMAAAGSEIARGGRLLDHAVGRSDAVLKVGEQLLDDALETARSAPPNCETSSTRPCPERTRHST